MRNVHKPLLAERTKRITPFIVMEILERAHRLEAEGIHVVHMEIGEPDFKTPGAIKAAASECLAGDRTKYTHSLGMPSLRAAIADIYPREYGVEIDPERVIVTTGSSAAMLLVFSALVDHGDEVLVTDPCYPCYPNFVRLAGGIPVRVPIGEEHGWQVGAAALRVAASKKTKAAVINSPANPTGIVSSPQAMEDIAHTADELCFSVVSDEIYHGMVYEGRAHSMLEFADQAIVINGFSKLYAMTGWRLGWVVVPPELVRPIQTLQQNIFISPPTLSQEAALAAFGEASSSDIKRMTALYDERRRWLVPRLRGLGFGIAAEPTGAFYVLANAKHLGADSYALALEILEAARVAVTPGVDFGPGAEGYLRFSYANSLDELREGCRRLEAWIGGRS